MKSGLIKIAASLLAASATIFPATGVAADVIFETVDAMELARPPEIRITGIVVGSATPTTAYYLLTQLSHVEPCERFLLLAMAKPGKYRLTLVGDGTYTCKLSLRTP